VWGGGNRWGNPPMGEPAPNAGYNGAIERWGTSLWGNPPPTRDIAGAI